MDNYRILYKLYLQANTLKILRTVFLCEIKEKSTLWISTVMVLATFIGMMILYRDSILLPIFVLATSVIWVDEFVESIRISFQKIHDVPENKSGLILYRDRYQYLRYLLFKASAQKYLVEEQCNIDDVIKLIDLDLKVDYRLPVTGHPIVSIIIMLIIAISGSVFGDVDINISLAIISILILLLFVSVSFVIVLVPVHYKKSELKKFLEWYKISEHKRYQNQRIKGVGDN